jgi:hypothetical protein
MRRRFTGMTRPQLAWGKTCLLHPRKKQHQFGQSWKSWLSLSTFKEPCIAYLFHKDKLETNITARMCLIKTTCKVEFRLLVYPPWPGFCSLCVICVCMCVCVCVCEFPAKSKIAVIPHPLSLAISIAMWLLSSPSTQDYVKQKEIEWCHHDWSKIARCIC